MSKIDDLPNLSLESSYEDNFLLAANGFDDNDDYVTGQVKSRELIDCYFNHLDTFRFHEGDAYLFVTYYDTDKPHMCGAGLSDTASNIASCISEQDYLYDYIGSCISDYVSNGYLNDYLSDYLSEYMSTYITSQIGSYVDNMSETADNSEISGVVVKHGDALEYVDGMSFEDIVRNCVLREDEPFPRYLDDGTELAGIYLSAVTSSGFIAPITVGDLISYIKAHL